MSDTVRVIYDETMLEHRPERWNPPEEVVAVEPELDPELDPDAAKADPDAEEIDPDAADATDGAPGGGSWGHPERPERIATVRALLEARPVAGVSWADAAPATRAMLERVHRSYYLDYVESLRGKTEMIDPDTTAVSPGSVEAAAVAAGAAVAAVEAVVRGEARHAMALSRPPGHHAMPARAMGFCLYSNVAVAAAHALAELGCERVLIVDWDLHHGNGTQEIFYDRRDVLLFDTHAAAPFYPGTGGLDEIGRDAGVGGTFNVPLPLGCDDATYVTAFETILEPVADMYEPDLVLVSAGFDPHHLDHGMIMTRAGFAALCGIVRRIADRHAGGRLAMILEGGYDADAIAKGTRACLEVLAGAEPPAIDPGDGNGVGLDAVAEARRYHGLS